MMLSVLFPASAAPPAPLFDAVAGYEKTVYGQGLSLTW